MKTKNYTPDGQHPEDAIFKAKTFINELQKVQEEYFTKLATDLNLNRDGVDWLFDYVYNTTDDENYDGFDHYLEDHKKKYDDVVSQDMLYADSAETFLSTDFGEFSPMMQMSSYEPDLETAFPPAYNSNEPFSLGLDTITIDTKNVKPDNQI
jgi:hypothetical protein